jgi:hypothetical protein
MNKRNFKLWHSLTGSIILLLIETGCIRFISSSSIKETGILLVATAGMFINIYVASEVIEEVRGARHMFMLLSVVVLQLVTFFAFQYAFLYMVQPASYPSLPMTPLSLFLHSLMIFVFNPLYLPATDIGRALMLVNTLGSLVLVLFILQNIGEFRKKSLDRIVVNTD